MKSFIPPAPSVSRGISPSVLYDTFGDRCKTLGIGEPIGDRFIGHAGVVVEIYALGRGITIERERANFGATQTQFELEAFGKFFVIDPDLAIKANGLVVPIERHVMTTWQEVQAVDKEKLSELVFGSGHKATSVKTSILCLPQGAGKSTIAERLALRIGCCLIVDEWLPSYPLILGALHLCQQDPETFVEKAE